VTPEAFVDQYFARTSLHVEGHPGKFAHVFSWEKLRLALARGRSVTDQRFNLMASYAGGERDGSSQALFPCSIDETGDLLNKGATVCITNIHMADPGLARWARAVRSQLNFSGTVGANCYISPEGGGLPMHYDKRVATSIQIAGSKRWFYSTKAAKPWPDNNAVFRDGRAEPADVDVGTLPPDMEIREVNLQAGDLLCLPAGAWHAARGLGVSMAINLYFAPRNFSTLLAPVLQDFAASNGSWRGGPPAALDPITGDITDPSKAYIRERLMELRALVDSMLASPDEMKLPWLNSLVADPFTGWTPEAKRALPSATKDTRFIVALPPLRFVEANGKVVIPYDRGLFHMPGEFAPVLKKIADHQGDFSVPEVLAWGQEAGREPPQAIISHLQALFQNGLIDMA
ncbi:MAG: cupin domain-containing protein, partial [Henriciella sp.]|uniref:JmjC domain-containing protein n=1 Tax=Henriciella sp. TaxID=1968823 RepID=UPI003C75032E